MSGLEGFKMNRFLGMGVSFLLGLSWPDRLGVVRHHTDGIWLRERMYVALAQSRPALCDPVDCGPPDSSVHGILQAGILEWVAIPFSRASLQPRDRTHISCNGR